MYVFNCIFCFSFNDNWESSHELSSRQRRSKANEMAQIAPGVKGLLPTLPPHYNVNNFSNSSSSSSSSSSAVSNYSNSQGKRDYHHQQSSHHSSSYKRGGNQTGTSAGYSGNSHRSSSGGGSFGHNPGHRTFSLESVAPSSVSANSATSSSSYKNHSLPPRPK